MFRDGINVRFRRADGVGPIEASWLAAVVRVLFKVYPQDSHYNATFPVARGLRALGHEVIYAGDEERRAPVEAQGFRFHPQAQDLLPKLTPGLSAPSRGRIFRALADLAMFWKHRAEALEIRIPTDGFDALLRELKPDILLVDSPYVRFALPLLQRTIRFGVLESMMRLDFRPGIPPPSSSLVPDRSLGSRIRCRVEWFKYWLNLRLLQAMGWQIMPTRKTIRDVLRRSGDETPPVDLRRYFHIGLTTAPEFILSLEQFDFPSPRKANQYYIGPSVDLDRVETGYDYIYHQRLPQWLDDKAQGRPLIYCSLGTASWRYPGAEDFFRRTVEASRGQNWNLVMAVGTELEPRIFNPLPPNVAVLQKVPQLGLLRKVDLAICHGGMNTVSECVLLRVPMLVYPGSADLDQPGNAARVVYHRIGLMGDLQRDTTEEIRNKIHRLLNTPSFKQQVTSMADSAFASRAHREGAQILVDALSGHAPAQ